MEDALKGGPTNLAVLSQQPEMLERCAPAFPWQGPVMEVLSMNLSFLNQLAPAVGRGALQCVWMEYFQ